MSYQASAVTPFEQKGWTSSLSVAEMTAIHQAGFEARGLVMGSSVYQLGYNYSPYYGYGRSGLGGPMGGMGGMGGWNAGGGFSGWSRTYAPDGSAGSGGWGGYGVGGMGLAQNAFSFSWERVVFEEGIQEAARLAIERMTEEAASLGAHGVVGTRLQFQRMEGLASGIEFMAVGTAVLRPGAQPLAHPFTSNLSGEDFYKLIVGGWVPVSLAVGAGSVACTTRTLYGGAWYELQPCSEAMQMSTRIAVERLGTPHVGADTVVGTTVAFSINLEEESTLVFETVLTGTSVKHFGPGALANLPLPVMRLSMP